MKNAVDDPKLPKDLVLLSALVTAAVGHNPPSSVVIDDHLATLAIQRHRVGPLLYAAARSEGISISCHTRSRLETTFRTNAKRQAIAWLLLQQFRTWFRISSISWMVFKGLPLAIQLYQNPAWRASSDIDLLVLPEDFDRALDILTDAGFSALHRDLPQNRTLRRIALRLFRDIALVNSKLAPYRIELHQRSLFGQQDGVEMFHPGCGHHVSSIPAPSVGADLAFYLIAHGALCHWARLKWLVDLVPLFGKLSDADKRMLVEYGISLRTESSLGASLVLLRMLYPDVALGPAAPWLDDVRNNRQVRRRLAIYARTLGAYVLDNHSPIDNRWLALKANLLFFESPGTRVQALSEGLASSVLRTSIKAMG